MFLCYYFRTLNRLKAFITSWRWVWVVFVEGNTRDWFAVYSWSIDTWQARALALLLWAEHSVTLQEENTPSFSSFLARGNERTCAFFWLDHCCWLRPGRAGSLLAAPRFEVDPAGPLDWACWSRGCTELCAAGSAISAASLPLLGSPLE